MATANRKPVTALKSRVTLDLDTMEREGDQPDPFVIRVGGHPITLLSVQDIDWQDAAALSPERPFQFFEVVVPADEYETFLGQRFPLWKLQLLIQQYQDHYGLTQAALGN